MLWAMVFTLTAFYAIGSFAVALRQIAVICLGNQTLLRAKLLQIVINRKIIRYGNFFRNSGRLCRE